MTSIFIVRPFGKKRVAITEGQSVEVDFDAIDRALIKPALAANGLEGETTEVIAAAGNIRVDMFEMLITYDLVIADISIDNANVFYELGIRHGLRPKGTILLRFHDAREGHAIRSEDRPLHCVRPERSRRRGSTADAVD